MAAPRIRCTNFLYFVGFLVLIVKSGITTAQVSKVNETKIGQHGNESVVQADYGVESSTPVISTIAVEATTNSVLASTTIESLATTEDDYYVDEDATEVTTTTEPRKIEAMPITKATAIPTSNHTHELESTTKSEAVTTTTAASTTSTTEVAFTTEVSSTTSYANLTTTTVASSPKNGSQPMSNDTDSNSILSAQIVTDLYIYYKMIAPVILRIIFGMVVSVKKVKAALVRPTGIAIALFCNFFYMPLVSCITKSFLLK